MGRRCRPGSVPGEPGGRGSGSGDGRASGCGTTPTSRADGGVIVWPGSPPSSPQAAKAKASTATTGSVRVRMGAFRDTARAAVVPYPGRSTQDYVAVTPGPKGGSVVAAHRRHVGQPALAGVDAQRL